VLDVNIIKLWFVVTARGLLPLIHDCYNPGFLRTFLSTNRWIYWFVVLSNFNQFSPPVPLWILWMPFHCN